MHSVSQWIFFYRGYGQALFFFILVTCSWFFPPLHPFEGEILDLLINGFALTSLVFGELLRIWAVSHAGRWTRSRHIKAPILVTKGPYAYTRNPIYLGNFLIGLGIVVLSENSMFTLLYLFLFTFLYRTIVHAEENFLYTRFRESYEAYCDLVPRWIPKLSIRGQFAFGGQFHRKEFGTAWGVGVGALTFEWLRWPLHQAWLGLLERVF